MDIRELKQGLGAQIRKAVSAAPMGVQSTLYPTGLPWVRTLKPHSVTLWQSEPRFLHVPTVGEGHAVRCPAEEG